MGAGRRLLAALFLLAAALKLWLWWRARGFDQGDPVEYVNIAYRIAFGIGIPWWDLRPLLLSLIYVPVLYAAQLWPDPTGEAMVKALRLVQVVFGLGLVWLAFRLGDLLAGRCAGIVGSLVVATNPIVNYLSVNTFAEIPSTFFIVLAAWLLLRRRSPAGWALAGMALGIGCMIRYQAIVMLPVFCLWVAGVAGWPGRRLVVAFCGGVGLSAIVQALIETIAYGRPFHSLIVSFTYNVSSGQAPVDFGQEAAEWYALTANQWLGLGVAALALLGGLAATRSRRGAEWLLLGVAAAGMFAFLSALPHKEARFTSQVVPFLAVFAGYGAACMLSWSGAARWVGMAIVVGSVMGPLWRTVQLDLADNVAYVEGTKLAAELKPGGVMATIPWFVPRPYAGTRLTLERFDRNRWSDIDYITRTVERSDFLLFPEYWLLEDRAVRRLVDANYRTVESYSNGVVLLQHRRLDEPNRRRPRGESGSSA